MLFLHSQMLPPTELHGNIINISYKIKDNTSKGICIGILHIPLSYINIITKNLLFFKSRRFVRREASLKPDHGLLSFVSARVPKHYLFPPHILDIFISHISLKWTEDRLCSAICPMRSYGIESALNFSSWNRNSKVYFSP